MENVARGFRDFDATKWILKSFPEQRGQFFEQSDASAPQATPARPASQSAFRPQSYSSKCLRTPPHIRGGVRKHCESPKGGVR